MGVIKAEAISTSRLDLLPLRADHAEEMAVVLADADLYAFTGGSPPSVPALRARYERMIAGSADPEVSWCNWVIQHRDQRCLTGTVQATITGPAAEVAWVVGTAWQGRGLGTEAARGLVAWLAERPVQEIIAHIHPRHEASARVAAAVGLSPTNEWQDGERRWRRTRCAPL
ncbi:MAG TPA: GNAT family N-acetyltransferase [Streptosporangiaceae bacterium]|jgi:RimJ/RimL family protein N-acetyltransferase|nr:GNAT family N-acetyltransferase [Streptosporangiaceae bacterium]